MKNASRHFSLIYLLLFTGGITPNSAAASESSNPKCALAIVSIENSRRFDEALLEFRRFKELPDLLNATKVEMDNYQKARTDLLDTTEKILKESGVKYRRVAQAARMASSERAEMIQILSAEQTILNRAAAIVAEVKADVFFDPDRIIDAEASADSSALYLSVSEIQNLQLSSAFFHEFTHVFTLPEKVESRATLFDASYKAREGSTASRRAYGNYAHVSELLAMSVSIVGDLRREQSIGNDLANGLDISKNFQTAALMDYLSVTGAMKSSRDRKQIAIDDSLQKLFPGHRAIRLVNGKHTLKITYDKPEANIHHVQIDIMGEGELRFTLYSENALSLAERMFAKLDGQDQPQSDFVRTGEFVSLMKETDTSIDILLTNVAARRRLLENTRDAVLPKTGAGMSQSRSEILKQIEEFGFPELAPADSAKLIELLKRLNELK